MNLFRSLLAAVNPAWLTPRFERLAPLPVRLIVGYGFIAHGYAKLVKHPDNFAAILHALAAPLNRS